MPETTMTSRPPTPPRTAYDSMQLAVSGFGELARRVARALRERHGVDYTGIVELEELAETEVMDFLKRYSLDKVRKGWSPDVAAGDAQFLGVHFHYAVNYLLHHRKTFWVDPPLAWALARTRLDLPGELLRLPFSCCALVFNDATTLELAERLYKLDPDRRGTAPLRVVTVYLMESSEIRGGGRGLQTVICLDDLQGGWPYVLGRDLRIEDDADLDAILASHFPDVDTGTLDPVFGSEPLKQLLHLAINAVLYATSAGIEIQPIESRVKALRAGMKKVKRTRRRQIQREIARFLNEATGEDVFFLPGKIDIKQVERLQAAERIQDEESGRTLATRFMVRGHWRRPAANWKEQRPIWIEPYWKGPDLATVIERDYRLRR